MEQKKQLTAALVTILVIILFALTRACLAQEGPAAGPEATAGQAAVVAPAADVPEVQEEMSLFDLIKKGGFVGYLIILLSVITLAMVIDYAVTIRKSKIAPPEDIAAFKKIVAEKNFESLEARNGDENSFFSRMMVAGLKEAGLGYDAMIKAMEDCGEALSARFARKIEHLNVIGNIAPMMGLLGTVIGMLRCFNRISHVAGVIEPKQLAGGIFEALVTTCMGLLVAIPALYFYSIFRNRVDEFTGEAALKAEELVAVFKRSSREQH